MPKVKTRQRKKTGVAALKRDDMLSPRGVAALCGCSDQTVRNAIERGELGHTPIFGPEGTVTGYAVSVANAMAWSPRKPGRPWE